MNNICDLIPNVDDLLSLEPAEIGGLILQILTSSSSSERSIHNRNNFVLGDMFTSYPRNKQAEAKKAVMEGWSWLETEGLIAADPDQNHGWIFVTRRGNRSASPDNFRNYRSSSALKKELLHPRVADKCWGAFLRGDYDSAVFMAFREVEIKVRELSGQAPEMVGTDLMRRAFGGALAPTHLPKAEQDSLAHLLQEQLVGLKIL